MSFVFKINNVDFSDLLFWEGCGQQHETLVDSSRDITGRTNFDIIRTGSNAVTKIYCKFKPLTQAEMARLQSAVANYIVNITFTDTRSNTVRTLRCYCGDNKHVYFRKFGEEELMYEAFDFNFIAC